MSADPVNLFGLSLSLAGEFDQKILHAYMQERLVEELDSIWKLLAGSGGAPAVQESIVAA